MQPTDPKQLLCLIEDKKQQLKEQEGGCTIIKVSSQYFVGKDHPPSKKRLKVNTSRSRGELKLLKMIIKKNNWVQVFSGGDVMWSGLALPEEQIYIATQILINRIPSMPHLCHKKVLGYILNKFRQYWPDQFWFYPRTYLLPQDEHKVNEQLRHGKILIAKPSSGCQGDGVTLIKKLADIPKIGSDEWIVQPYIDKPLLLKGKKFDLRLYVLISSVQPYLCYLNEEGLARFCSQNYQIPTKQNFHNPYIHLTNYSLNKNHPAYENGTTVFSSGGKRCLKVVWEELQEQGIDVSQIRAKILQLTQKFLTGIYPFLKYYYRATFRKQKGKCFHVIGLDVLIDENLRPWLLQSNNNPSFNIEHEPTINGIEMPKEISPVDEYVKNIVVEDAIFLTKRSIQKQQEMMIGDMYYSFQKILDEHSFEMNQLNIIQHMLQIFHSQCSIRSKWVLTSSQFCKLALFQGMTSQKITKNDYHLIFIKIMRQKANPIQMSFEDFIQAMEYIVKQIRGYDQQNKLEIMQAFVMDLISQIPQ